MNSTPGTHIESATQAHHLCCSNRMIRRESEDRERLPGDAAISARALTIAAIHGESTRLVNLNRGHEITPLVNALIRLGAPICRDGDDLIVTNLLGSADRERVHSLNFASSFSGACMMLGVLAGLGIPAVLDGDQRAREANISWVVDPLQHLGARIEYMHRPSHLPVRVFPRHLRAGEVHVADDCLLARDAILVAALVARIKVRIVQIGQLRDHLVCLLRSLGAKLVTEEQRLSFEPSDLQPYPSHIIPNDPTSCAYLVAAHLLQGRAGDLRLDGVCLNPGRTRFIELMRQAGMRISYLPQEDQGGEPVGSIVAANCLSKLRPISISTRAEFLAMDDEIPLAATIASQIDGISEFVQPSTPSLKQNRFETTCSMLRSFGVAAVSNKTSLRIPGGRPFAPGVIASRNDHRIAMTAAIAGCAAPGTTRVLEGGCYATSFPSFTSAMRWHGFDVMDDHQGRAAE